MTGMLVWWKIALFALLGSSLFYAGTRVGEISSAPIPAATPSSGFVHVATLPRNGSDTQVSRVVPPQSAPAGNVAHFVEEIKKKQAQRTPQPSSAMASALASVRPARVAAPVASTSQAVSVFDASMGSVAIVEGTGVPTSSLPADECHFETTMFPRYRSLIINEVGWMGTSEDSAHEWIELKNPEIDPMRVKGYWLIDQAEQIVVQFPDITVPAGGFLVLERGEDALPEYEADIVYSGALSNSNEGLRVFDPYCSLLDSVIAGPKWPAGNSAEKRSMERGGDWEWYAYTGKTVNDILGTPGKKNSHADRKSVVASSGAITSTELAAATSSAPPPVEAVATTTHEQATTTPAAPASGGVSEGHIIITEVFVGSEQSSDDEFIELYNPTSAPIDLTGWSLKKKSSSGSESSLVASTRLQGKSVAAGSYFLIARDQKYLGSVTPDASWASSISLAYTNNAVLLYDASGAITDETAWAELAKGQSWKREPITGDTFSVGVPSPRH